MFPRDATFFRCAIFMGHVRAMNSGEGRKLSLFRLASSIRFVLEGENWSFKSTYSQFALVEAHPKRFVSEKQSEVRNLSKFVNFLPMIFNHDRVLLFFHFAGVRMEVPMDWRYRFVENSTVIVIMRVVIYLSINCNKIDGDMRAEASSWDFSLENLWFEGQKLWIRKWIWKNIFWNQFEN